MAPKKRDLKDLGWSINDFGPFSAKDFGIPMEPPGTVGQAIVNQAGYLPAKNIPPTPQLPQNYLSRGMDALDPGQVALGDVQAKEQMQVRNYLANPDAFINERIHQQSNVFDKGLNYGATFLSNLFTLDDKEDVIGESAWHAMFNGLGWAYNTINQVTTAGISVLPGGIDTLTWDQAGDVSVGQALAANQAQMQRQLRESGPLGAAIAPLTGGPPQAIGAMMSLLDEKGYSQDPIYGRANFDITDPAQREAAFVKNTQGRWTSGVADLVFSVFADPLIVGGKFLKLARIKWVDKPVKSQEQIAAFSAQIQDDVAKQAAGTTDNMSAVGKFLTWATERTPDGQKVRSVGQITRHKVMRDAANPDALVAAIHNADNFEEASLVMRVAYGDLDAKADLLSKRADLALSIGQAQRDRLALQMAMNPRARRKTVSEYQKRVSAIQRSVNQLARDHRAQFGVDVPETPLLMKARMDLAREQELLTFARSGRVPNIISHPATKDELALADAAVNRLIAQDDRIQNLLSSGDVDFTLRGATRGFGGRSAFGRAVEASRQRRAEAAWESASTQGRGVWRKDEFYQTNRAVRMVRVWRWLGQERPEGYVATKGVSAIDSGREIMAMLNNVKLYSGKGVEVAINGKTQTIGGIAAKNALLDRYYATVGSAYKDQTIMQKALLGIEDQVMRDIGAAYGLERDAVEGLLREFNSRRQKLIDDIRNRKYWADPVPNSGAVDVNKAPWLDSQLENGMYMMDLKLAEKLAAQSKGTFRAALGATGEKLGTGYEVFNELWRPAVLLRLGYTQRNVLEGLIRSSAYMMSLAPVANGGKQMYYGITNPIRRARVNREMAEIDELLKTPSNAAKLAGTKFGKWRETQLKAITDRIAAEEQWADDHIDLLKILQRNGTSRDDVDVVWQNLRAHAKQLDEMRNQKALLMQDNGALSLYWKQAAAKRRVYDGFIDGADPDVWKQAFNSDLAPVYLRNLSSDGTTRSMATLKVDATNGIYQASVKGAPWKKTNTEYFVDINPGEGERYWSGIADALMQVRNSDVGEMVLRGANAKQIARFLMNDERGRNVRYFIQSASDEFPLRTMKEAEEYGQTIIDRVNELAPNPELVKLAGAGRVGVGGKDATAITAADVQRFLNNPTYISMLKPVVGHKLETLNVNKNSREIWNAITMKGFNILGTIPEDAMVRAPFYGQVYERAIRDSRRLLLDKYGADKDIPLSEVGIAMKAAHSRALKDTRKYLYTIERRTNLGAVGEYTIPFVSASQNAITTVGRLVWNDPSIIGIANLVWNAPDRAGLVDEQGNISLVYGLNMLPQGFRDATGLDAMKNVKFPKMGLNTILPDTGFFGVIPRPGPLVSIPSSLLMQKGFFGLYTPEAPEILVSIAGGDRKTADTFWSLWKDWVYGENQGLASDIWMEVLPPAWQKGWQVLQGPGSSKEYARWFDGIYRTEVLKKSAGLRDDDPTGDEIAGKAAAFQFLRVLANLTLVTPPQYDLKVQPILDAVRTIEQQAAANGTDGKAEIYRLFGETLPALGDFSVTKNVGGIQPSTDATARARKYGNLIAQVSPTLRDNLDVLGIILNANADQQFEFDSSAYNWQYITTIPGTNRTYRELQSPEDSLAQSRISAGWVRYLKGVEYLDVLLQQRGFTDYRQDPELNAMKKALVETIRKDELYSGWYEEFDARGSKRASNTVYLLTQALKDPEFIADNEGNPVWQAASQYLYLRNEVLDMLDQVGGQIDSQKNAEIQALWNAGRETLKKRYVGWGPLANRYLSGDDDPSMMSAAFE